MLKKLALLHGKSDSLVNIFAHKYGVLIYSISLKVVVVVCVQDLKSQEPVTLDFLDAELEDEVKVEVRTKKMY